MEITNSLIDAYDDLSSEDIRVGIIVIDENSGASDDNLRTHNQWVVLNLARAG